MISWSAKLIGVSALTLLTLNNCPIQNWQTSSDRSPIPPQADRLCPFEGSELTYQINPPIGSTTVSPAVINTTREVFAKRISTLGVRGTALVQLENSPQLLVQLPGTVDAQLVQQRLGVVGKLEFRMQKPGTESQLTRALQARQDLQARQQQLKNSGDQAAIVQHQQAMQLNHQALDRLFDPPALTGQDIQSAAISSPHQQSNWSVSITFDAQGTNTFAQLTQQLAGTDRTLGIFWDGELISAPTVPVNYVATGITGGKAELTGNFTAETVKDLVIQLQSGHLPTTVELLKVEAVRRDRSCQLVK